MISNAFTGMIMSVTGPLPAGEMGFTLPHEHVMSTFGADPARYPAYETDQVLAVVLPYLEKVKNLGCQTLIDCTAAYFGRHPELLRRISLTSGMHILTNTGYYAAAGDRYVPEHARIETAEQIAARWVHEFQDGIDETGVHPGFIKTAVDDNGFSELDCKLVRAACLTHRQTGLVIQTHTGGNLEAVQGILAGLKETCLSPSAWIWVHAHNVVEASHLISVAHQGVWISLDGISSASAAHILDLLLSLKKEGLLSQVLLSHDGDSYCAGSFRPYEYLMSDFLAILAQSGFTHQEVRQLTVENPQRAFTIQPRLI